MIDQATLESAQELTIDHTVSHVDDQELDNVAHRIRYIGDDSLFLPGVSRVLDTIRLFSVQDMGAVKL